MSDNLLVTHCSPTLAGMKSGSLFSYSFESTETLGDTLSMWNSQLNEKGLFIRVLCFLEGRALIYAYRPKKLLRDFEAFETKAFLAGCGYEKTDDIEYMMDSLSEKIASGGCFPHEIGLFLGYPLEDVKGFIVNKGKNCKCVGCWKVYTDEIEAKRVFAKFRKCTDVYCRKFTEGLSIQRLTVAA